MRLRSIFTLNSRWLAVGAAVVVGMSASISFAQTPPVQPKIDETPLPAALTLPPPANIPADVVNKPLTADEAAAIALYRQPGITVAEAGISAAQGRTRQTRSGLLPTVSAGTSYTNAAIVSPAPGVNAASLATAQGYQVTAGLRQLVFDFNHTRDLVRQASAQVQAANANLLRVRSDLVLQVKQAFYTLAQNKQLVGVSETNLRNQQSHLASAHARLDSGLGIPADVVRAETAVADASQSLTAAQNNEIVSRVILAQLMGIDPRTPIEIADTNEPATEPGDLNQLVATALNQRPDIKQLIATAQAAGYGVRAAKSGNAPAVGASASWLQKGSNFPPDSNSLLYGVAITWTPFDSGLTKGRVQEAQANLQSIQAQIESARLGITSEVSQAYVNLQTALQRVKTTQSEVNNATESVRLVEGRYKSGLGSFLDVLDAQSALTKAQTDLVNSRFGVDQARAALAHAVGTAPLQTASEAKVAKVSDSKEQDAPASFSK